MPATICITLPLKGFREKWKFCIPIYIAWPFWPPIPDPWKDGGFTFGDDPLPIGPEVSAIAALAQLSHLKGLDRESQKLLKTSLSAFVSHVSQRLPEGGEISLHDER